MKNYLFTLLIFFLIPLNSTAQSQQDTSLTRKLDELIKQRLPSVGPGCVVLVAKKGQIIYKKAFGLSDLPSKKPMRADMIFRIGSMTKQYTAIATLQLVELGKISLQDTIQKYVKEFPYKGYPIKIENFLTQTSGIQDYMTLQNHDPAKERDEYTPAQGVDYFKDAPLNFTPGSKFEYSNSNFYLLGYIIELVTGQSYESYIKEHLLKPAGLEHTYYLHKGENVPNLTPGYSRPDGKNWEPAELQDPTVMYATGGLMSNVDDLFKWHQALSAGKLISTQMLKKAYTPFRLADGSLSEYAYGWFIRDLDGSTTIEHSGSTDGYQTDEIYLPQEDVFIVALFNGFEYDMDFIMLPNDIARLAAGKPLRPELKLTDDSLKQYTGTYTYNSEHQMVVTFKNHQLFVDDTYQKDNLHAIKLYAKNNNRFYIKEAPIDFEFVPDPSSKKFMLVTYNAHGKDAEWKQ
ncbi:CubicO group peptidase (beta-lactamase class C family) [Mucilaginibacter lappiensis]|uniref:CubicO group peptidase (Beta-lactamase class C family) n=1 Tax=Mucilaginibacter lappiensis TaxID=354630 RepID=A0ABR6PQ39_9SPHI|nr:serine hydrolase domain-containing protein [Mucilaginibacter lappiensis]MBB6111877.1 CubicO group peptidase (beta-lactamase class C family) [Mucilaginibacter lappiensis]